MEAPTEEWFDNLKALEEHLKMGGVLEENTECRVGDRVLNVSLWWWDQQRRKKNGDLSKQEEFWLKKLPGWEKKRSWHEWLNAMTIYIERGGNIAKAGVKWADDDGVVWNLSDWLTYQRKSQRIGTLSEEKNRFLGDLLGAGWCRKKKGRALDPSVWLDALRDSGGERFYRAKNGKRLDVSKWLEARRKEARAGTLSAELKGKIEEAGYLLF